MRVLKIWSTFQTELKYHDHYLADEMMYHGIKTTFMASDKLNKEYIPYLKNKHLSSGVDTYNCSKIIRLKSVELFNKQFIVELKRMRQEICSGNYDLIHIFGISNPITWYVFLILKKYNEDIPIFFNDHSNPDLKSLSIIGKVYYNINKFMFSKFKNRVKCVITPNLASYNFIKERYSLGNDGIAIIPLGYDSKIFNFDAAKKNKEKDKLIIGFAGKVLKGKNLELLFDAIKEIDDKDICCKIVGINIPYSEYQSTLINYAEKINLSVEFEVLIKNSKQLAEFYNFIDIAVFPGSISITTLEATGCGTPIVLYESIEGLEDRVENGRGVLFNTKEELKKYILNFKKMKERKMINNCHIEEQSKLYSWSNISKSYLSLYKVYLSKDLNK